MSKSKRTSKKVSLSKQVKRPSSFLSRHFWLISAVCLTITFISLLIIRNVEIEKRERLSSKESINAKVFISSTELEENSNVIDLSIEPILADIKPGSLPGWQKYTYKDAGFSIEVPSDVSPVINKEKMNFTEEEDFYLQVFRNYTNSENHPFTSMMIRISVLPENTDPVTREPRLVKKNLLGGLPGYYVESCSDAFCVYKYDLRGNSKNYLVDVYPRDTENEIQKQILSSFAILP